MARFALLAAPSAVAALARRAGLTPGARPRRWRAPVAGLLAALAVAGCATAPPGDESGDAARDPQAVVPSADLVATAYTRMADLHITQPDFPGVVAAGLDGLGDIDGALAADRTDEAVVLYRGDSPLARYPLPDGNTATPRQWTAITREAIATAARASPAVAASDEAAVTKAVLQGQMGHLDRFSRYNDPEAARAARDAREGYGGIGVELRADTDGTLRIAEVIAGTPAAAQGLEAGDTVLSLAGRPASALSVPVAAETLRGAPGTTVSLTLRPRDGEPVHIHLDRARILQPTVHVRRRADGVVVLDIARFNDRTAEDMADALADIQASTDRPAGLVLDLRGNPGGLLAEAVAVADLFLAEGLIARTRGRHPGSVQHYSAHPEQTAPDLPTAVLVNESAASGAEVVAAALQDRGRAVVVGTVTYGKGSVQTVSRLPNDGELYITWARIFAPAGYTLDALGVVPTLCLSAGRRGDVESYLATQLENRRRRDEIAALLAAWRDVPADATAMKESLRAECRPVETRPGFAESVAATLLAEEDWYRRAQRLARPDRVARRR